MKQKKGFIVAALLCLSLLTAACGKSTEPGTAPTDAGPDLSESPVKVMAAGTILTKRDNVWMATAYAEGSDSHYVDAYSLTVNNKTIFESYDGSKLTAEQIPVGSSVEVWIIGRVMESYPAQTDAYKFVLLEDDTSAGADRVSRNEAVKAAIDSQTINFASDFFAVKSVQLTEDNAFWEINLAVYHSIGQSALVRIDTATGAVEPTIVEQNEAFRIFSPASGSEVDAVFTVQGQARVFEGAFSWSLEDGHNVLAEGNELAEHGAPEWGDFSFDVSFDKSSLPNVTLFIYTYSAKDGSTENQLVIGLNVPEELVQYSADSDNNVQ